MFLSSAAAELVEVEEEEEEATLWNDEKFEDEDEGKDADTN